MRPLFLALPFAFLVACQVPISNQNFSKAVGTVEVSIDLDKQTATASWQPRGIRTQAVQTTTSIQLVSNSQPLGFVSNPATNTDFISAKFNVSNLTGNALTELTLVAFHKSGNPGNQSDTAIKNIVNFVGASLDNEVFARGIKPANMVTGSLTLDAGNEDLQLFTEAEVSRLQTQANAVGEINTSTNEYLFPYGYVSRATGSSTSRTLSAGTNTGTLNIAIRIPNNNAAPNNSVRRFNMTFVAFDQPVATRVSESLEEQGANSGAVTRANASNFNASRVAALQNSALHVAKDGTKVNICQVRTAGTATNPLARLETSTLASGSGTLDTCFAALGKRVLSKADLGGGSPYGKKLLAQQADGKYVVGGNLKNGATLDFVVARYNQDGSLDSTFGTYGQVITDFSGGDDTASALTLDSNQKIVVVGRSLNQFNQFAIARYNTNGSLDTTFDADGKVTTSFGANVNSSAYAVAFDSSNKIIVVGSASAIFAITKYNIDGSLDNNFDTDGKLTFSSANVSINELYAVAVDSNNKIIVGGSPTASSSTGFYVYRLNSNGVFDTDFNGTGSVVTSGTGLLLDLKIDGNGKIVAMGGGGSNIVMARYDSSGVLDNQFGTAGIVTINLTGREDVPSALTLDANGRLIVAGASGTPNSEVAYLIARFLENGGLDTTFGNNGKLVWEVETGLPKQLTSVISDSSGKIVTAGLFVNLEFPPTGIADIVWGLSLFRINP